MKRVNFNQLKNLEISERLMSNVLNVPKREKKKPFLLRYYQQAIGFAAAVIVAVGVSMFLFFGSGSNSRVNIPSISPQNTTQAEYSADNTGKKNTPALQSPSTENDGTSAVSSPEPAEESKPQAVTPPRETDNKSDSKAADTQPAGNTASEKPKESTSAEQGKTEQQAGTEVLFSTQTAASGIATQPASDGGKKGCVIICRVSTSQLSVSAYCKLVGDDGSILGSQNLFDSSHRVTEKNLGNGKTELTYLVDGKDVKSAEGKMYFAVFYDGGGEILKQSPMIYLFEDLYVNFN